jgi:pyruvate dehydrogenase E1 component
VPDDRHYITLGTDGFGRSDTRDALRRFFETDAGHIAVAALGGLADQGDATSDDVAKAIAHYQIDTEAPDPRES